MRWPLFEQEEHARTAGVRNPAERVVFPLLADACAANQQVEQPVATLRRANAVYPRDEQFYVALAALCLEHDSFELGREIVQIGMQNVPGSPRLYASWHHSGAAG